MEKLVIVCSITIEECYEIKLKESLSRIGIPYTLILTDSNLPLSESNNSIMNYLDLKNSKYILFAAQDVGFLDDNWGKKIVDWADSSPDFGYAGVEGRDINNNLVNYFVYPQTKTDGPVKVVTCDGAIGIIPTRLFLQRQFDKQFPWFPMFEDYALWILLEKHLNVYSFPLTIFNGCSGMRQTRWLATFPSYHLYANSLHNDWYRCIEKWRKLHPEIVIYGKVMRDIPNTTWGT